MADPVVETAAHGAIEGGGHAAAAHGFDVTPVVVLLAAAVIAVPLFKRIGLGTVLGYLAAGQDIDPASHWRMLVRRHFRGVVKPPFNDSARATAGLTRDFYAPLADMEPEQAQADRL